MMSVLPAMTAPVTHFSKGECPAVISPARAYALPDSMPDFMYSTSRYARHACLLPITLL
jgi:hypothetical protein